MGFVLAPGWRRAGVLTDAELTEVRYGRRAATVLRGIKAIYFGTLFNCTVLAFVFLRRGEDRRAVSCSGTRGSPTGSSSRWSTSCSGSACR